MATKMHPSCLSALRTGDMDLLGELLVEDQTRFYGMTVKGNNILHIAASLGNDRLITQACSNPEFDNLVLHQNLKGDTILHCAARAGHDHILLLLINHQAGRQMTGLLNQRGDSALHEAARGGHAEVVRLLLAVGENMASMVNGDGESPLYLAVMRGSVKIVKMLLGCAMLDFSGPRGQTALHAAVVRRFVIVKLLLEKMPALNLQADDSQSTPIHYAAFLGEVNTVHLMLKVDATVAHLLDNKGFSAIHIAASKNQAKVIEEILHHCPDATELTDGDGNNFLHVAAKTGATTVVKLVLNNPLLGQSINETNHEGNTPLHLAAMNQKIEIIQLLLSCSRVDKNVINRESLTPLDIALSIDASGFGFKRWMMMSAFVFAGTKSDPRRLDIVMFKDQGSPKERLDFQKAMANNLSIMVVLIATVTFAAAFTLPGGYNNNDSNQEQGMAVLAKKVAFQVFLISDTIAMVSSMCVIFLLIYSRSPDRDIRLSVIHIAMAYVQVALGGMLVAFSTGIFVVMASQCRWLAYLICGMTICVPFIVFLSTSFIRFFVSIACLVIFKDISDQIKKIIKKIFKLLHY